MAQGESDMSANSHAREVSASGHELPERWFAMLVLIWVGQAVSMITSYAAGFAVVWHVTDTTGSALALAAMSVANYLPIGLLSPFAGVIADRFPRKRIMIMADGGLGLVSLAFAFLILAGHASLPMLVVLSVVRAVGQAFHSPAMLAAIPSIVPERHLVRINTLDQALMSIAAIGAPAFGIALYEGIGFHSVMFLDFAGAMVACAALVFARIPTVIDDEAASTNVWDGLRAGFAAIAVHRGLLVLLVGIGLALMIVSPLEALVPLMTKQHFNGGGFEASVVEAAYGVGMLAGSALLIWRGGGARLARLVCISVFISGIFTFTMGLLPASAFVVFVALSVLMATVDAWFSSPLMTLMQTRISEEKLGRAMGLISAVMGIATPVGISVGGVLADVVGVAPMFFIAGASQMIAGLVLFFLPSVRTLDAAE